MSRKPYTFIDIPTMHKLTGATDPDQHHPKCSYREGFVCDCAAMTMARAAWDMLNAQWEAYLAAGER